MVFSITVFSVLISWKSYTNKVYDLINTRKLENLNTELQNLKQGLEAKVAQRTNELLLAKEKAEESNRLKTAFLNNISHEIRTPLNSICGFAEFLSNQNLDRDRIRNYSEIILTSSHQLLSVVTDILSISSIETKQEVIEENETDLKAITQELFNDYYLLANEKGLTLRIVNLSNSTDSIVIADGKRIKRILSYLLSNALKFTHNGVVEFGYAQKENTLDFFVKDTGIGIDSRYHQIIFEKFIQANDSIQRLYGGNGLGLSICKGYVQLLGGRIWVESELGRGSTFFVEIPYQSK
jgi:signal transduction histidine kinase